MRLLPIIAVLAGIAGGFIAGRHYGHVEVVNDAFDRTTRIIGILKGEEKVGE